MPEPTDSGTRIEYAVRYDEPKDFAGLVAHIRQHESIARGMARQEMQHPGGDFRCVVVRREVIYGEWTEVVAAGSEPNPPAVGDRSSRTPEDQ